VSNPVYIEIEYIEIEFKFYSSLNIVGKILRRGFLILCRVYLDLVDLFVRFVFLFFAKKKVDAMKKQKQKSILRLVYTTLLKLRDLV